MPINETTCFTYNKARFCRLVSKLIIKVSFGGWNAQIPDIIQVIAQVQFISNQEIIEVIKALELDELKGKPEEKYLIYVKRTGFRNRMILDIN